MEINNHGKNLHVHYPVKNNSQEVGNVDDASNVERSVEAQSNRLLDRLRSGDAVRDRLIVEVQAKVQAGEYFTRAAAEQAAQQIVD